MVIDNLSSYKVAGIEKAIQSAEAMVLYLPAYSPDFNPTEMVFSKRKILVRKAKSRSVKKLWINRANFASAFRAKNIKIIFGMPDML